METMSSGVHMHGMNCPVCDTHFYTELPSPVDVEEVIKSVECVECDVQIQQVYQFTDRDDHVEMECKLSVIDNE